MYESNWIKDQIIILNYYEIIMWFYFNQECILENILIYKQKLLIVVYYYLVFENVNYYANIYDILFIRLRNNIHS